MRVEDKARVSIPPLFLFSSWIWLFHVSSGIWTQLNPWFSLNIQVHLIFMCGFHLPHHYILGSVSIFKCDDLSALKHLCVAPLHHITISWAQFQHSSVMTFLHLNIYAWVLKSAKKKSIQISSYMCSPTSTVLVALWSGSVRITLWWLEAWTLMRHLNVTHACMLVYSGMVTLLSNVPKTIKIVSNIQA